MIKKLLMALVLMPMMAFAKDYVLDHDGWTCDDFGTVSFPAYFKGSLTSAEGAVPFNGYAPFQFVAPATGVYNMSLEITRNNGTQIKASASLRDTLESSVPIEVIDSGMTKAVSITKGKAYTVSMLINKYGLDNAFDYSFTFAIYASTTPDYKVRFYKNNSTTAPNNGGDDGVVQSHVKGQSKNLLRVYTDLGWNYDGYKFVRWDYQPSTVILGSYSDGELVKDVGSAAGTVDLQARWEFDSSLIGTYLVAFYKNDASSAAEIQRHKVGSSQTLTSVSSLGWSISGCSFAGWSTSPGASTAIYHDAERISNLGSAGKIVKLYAVWQVASPTTYTITYSPGADGTGTQQTATKTKDVALTLKEAIFTRKGYVQDGWTTADGDLYRLGDSFSGNVSMTFYPLWEPNKYSVSYVLNGGAFVSGGNQQEMHPDLVLFGDSFAVSPIERTGFVFTGWTVTSGLDSSTAKWLVAQKKAKAGEDSQNAVLNPYEEHGIESALKLCSPDDDGFVRFKNLTPVANGKVTLTANWTKSQFSADDLNLVLAQGWTWVSVNVQPQDASFASVFKGVSFVDDDVIKSSGGSATYYGGTWYPSPATFMFIPGRAYAVKKSTAGTATVTVGGTPAVPSLTVTAGWNWIGPTTDKPVSLDALKHSGGFADDDVISSTSRSSTHYGGKWYGSLQSLEPGVGYKARFDNNGTISTQSNE